MLKTNVKGKSSECLALSTT